MIFGRRTIRPPHALRWVVVGLWASGCAASDPFLSPTRAIAPGRVILDLGFAYQQPTGPSVLRAARDPAASPEALREAAAVYASHAPGVTSYVAGRFGLGNRAELTAAAIGTTLRVGLRREVYAEGNWVAATGFHVRGGSLATDVGQAVPGMTVDSSLVLGGDVMFFGGYVRRNIYDFWFGPRVGYSYTSANVMIASVQPNAFDVNAHRLEASFVFGGRINYGHIGIGMEVDAVQTWAWGSDGRQNIRFSGLTLIPAGALSYQF